LLPGARTCHAGIRGRRVVRGHRRVSSCRLGIAAGFARGESRARRAAQGGGCGLACRAARSLPVAIRGRAFARRDRRAYGRRYRDRQEPPALRHEQTQDRPLRPARVELAAMTETDKDVAAAWRAANREEPPPALDDAIRAGARREVGARPHRARATPAWWPLAAAATVAVVAIGIVEMTPTERVSPEIAA